jgi:hypothetical protein
MEEKRGDVQQREVPVFAIRAALGGAAELVGQRYCRLWHTQGSDWAETDFRLIGRFALNI